MLQPSLARTFVSSSSTSPPDATRSAVFCVVGATALLHGVVMSDPAYTTGMIVAAKFRSSGRCGVTPRSETGQSLGLILKGRDNLWQADHPQHSPHPTTRTEQFQATALTPEQNIRPDNGADARTIQLRHVCQVQHQLKHAGGD